MVSRGREHRWVTIRLFARPGDWTAQDGPQVRCKRLQSGWWGGTEDEWGKNGRGGEVRKGGEWGKNGRGGE